MIKEKHSKLIMLGFLGVLLLAVIIGIISYYYFRKDPVTIVIKNAQGYLTTEVSYKHPNDTVGNVISSANVNPNDYSCTLDLNEKMNATNVINLNEIVEGTIKVDGQTIPFSSTQDTIGGVLEENNIAIAPVDRVSPTTSTILTSNNSNIVVDRVTTETQTVTEIIPYIAETRQSDEVPYNQVKVLQEGQNGLRSYTEETIYDHGVPIERNITSDQRTSPVNQILEVGTNLTIGKPDIQKGDIEAWRPYVIKALEENGLEPTELRVTRILNQINTESAGDQNAHQEVIDINTFLGQEARGLMQTIPSTFDYYKHPGYDDILNGYHNLLAAINYAKDVYGDDFEGLGVGIGY